jgi:hypothetical protein
LENRVDDAVIGGRSDDLFVAGLQGRDKYFEIYFS